MSMLISNRLRADLASTAAGKGAALVSFKRAAAGSVRRPLDAEMQNFVTIAQFGGVGNGVANDRNAVANAIATQKPILWIGSSGNNFRIESPITQTVTADVIWQGNGANIVYGGAHTEYAIRLADTAGVQFLLSDITVDGGKLCNKTLEVLNNTSLSTASDFITNNSFFKRAKRLNTFSGGDGLNIRGAFNQVVFNGGGVSDCELPAGQGQQSVIGIGGVSIDWYSVNSYVKRVVVNGMEFEKIYSSDLAYNHDQDGIKYFVPDNAAGTGKVFSEFICYGGSTFKNCYGRSIKTQCATTNVTDSAFERTEGTSNFTGNGEIDAQTGSLFTDRLVFRYSNGYHPGVCVSSSSDAQYGRPGLTAGNSEVYLDAATTLPAFGQNFPRNGQHSRQNLDNIKVYGKVVSLFDLLCNGAKNYLDVTNCYATEIAVGPTGERALVYARASGLITPRGGFITAIGNIHDSANSAALVRDAIPGVSVSTSLSAWGNIGFQNTLTPGNTSTGLKTNQVGRLGKFTSGDVDAYMEVLSKIVPAGGVATFDVANASGCLLMVQARFNSTAFALVSSTQSTNTGVAVGSSFGVGNASEPASGTFRLWSSGANQVTVRNTDASARVVSVFVMAP
jgi:hypothetical protein